MGGGEKMLKVDYCGRLGTCSLLTLAPQPSSPNVPAYVLSDTSAATLISSDLTLATGTTPGPANASRVKRCRSIYKAKPSQILKKTKQKQNKCCGWWGVGDMNADLMPWVVGGVWGI